MKKMLMLINANKSMQRGLQFTLDEFIQGINQMQDHCNPYKK